MYGGRSAASLCPTSSALFLSDSNSVQMSGASMTSAPANSPAQPSGVRGSRGRSAATLRRRRSAGRPILGERHGKDDQEEDLGGGARVTELPAAERAFEE